MKLSEFLQQSPDVFWALVYSAWGGVYAAITVSLLLVHSLTQRWNREFPDARWRLFTLQLVGSASHLLAVFSIPGLVGAMSAEVIRESKYPLTVLVWAPGVFGFYFLARPFRKLWEIGQ